MAWCAVFEMMVGYGHQGKMTEAAPAPAEVWEGAAPEKTAASKLTSLFREEVL